MEKILKVGIITVSDRASQGIYQDQGGPAVLQWLQQRIKSPVEFKCHILPDELIPLQQLLLSLIDEEDCGLVVTTGGTGPSSRDITPEATQAICTKILPGFGEIMRAESFKITPTAILSRQMAGIRGRSLVINLPGKPKSIGECLNAVFPAIVHGIILIREVDLVAEEIAGHVGCPGH